MEKDKKAFGNLLRKMIRESGISQSDFYTAIEITRPYFYDILSGKVNPPPHHLQFKMLEKLNANEEQRAEFLNTAAEGRGEIPADISAMISGLNIDKVRTVLSNLIAERE